MTESATGLSPLTDPSSSGPFEILPDEGDEELGMAPEEIDEFLRQPVEPMRAARSVDDDSLRLRGILQAR